MVEGYRANKKAEANIDVFSSKESSVFTEHLNCEEVKAILDAPSSEKGIEVLEAFTLKVMQMELQMELEAPELTVNDNWFEFGMEMNKGVKLAEELRALLKFEDTKAILDHGWSVKEVSRFIYANKDRVVGDNLSTAEKQIPELEEQRTTVDIFPEDGSTAASSSPRGIERRGQLGKDPIINQVTGWLIFILMSGSIFVGPTCLMLWVLTLIITHLHVGYGLLALPALFAIHLFTVLLLVSVCKWLVVGTYRTGEYATDSWYFSR